MSDKPPSPIEYRWSCRDCGQGETQSWPRDVQHVCPCSPLSSVYIHLGRELEGDGWTGEASIRTMDQIRAPAKDQPEPQLIFEAQDPVAAVRAAADLLESMLKGSSDQRPGLAAVEDALLLSAFRRILRDGAVYVEGWSGTDGSWVCLDGTIHTVTPDEVAAIERYRTETMAEEWKP